MNVMKENGNLNVAESYIIVDIDGTLADTDHRLHHLYPPPGKKKNWGAFFGSAKHDPLIPHVKTTVDAFWALGATIILLTGRPDNLRDDTETWLKSKGVKYRQLLMRETSDHRPDYIVKQELFQKHLGHVKDKILCAMEDRLHVAEMWRKLGIPVLLCNDEWRESGSQTGTLESAPTDKG